MRQSWRWFGPHSGVTMDDIRQAGATDIVTALHEVPIGEVWTRRDIEARKALIEDTPPGRTPLKWSVVESIPVPDAVKRLGAQARAEIDAWIASMEALAACDIKTICYNFMPVIDWCRTEFDFVTPIGSTAMRFDHDRYMAFDIFILQRPHAARDYAQEDIGRARLVYENMGDEDIAAITRNIAGGLPGTTSQSLTIPQFRDVLALYAGIDAQKLKRHLIEFLQIVTPVAEELGIRLTLHPDDPPRSLFGLPRIASTEEDYAQIFAAVPSSANGMCYCTGSLGVRADNNLIRIAQRFAPRIYFAHLRATKREADGRSFHEAAHLEGDVDMVGVVKALLAEDKKRNPQTHIIFRPDHGQCLLDDLHKNTAPGYPSIGRLRGLAEVRGIITALEAA